ncbi:hypothetical protein RR46_10761 [Papilio xuthus]|uniref:Uncharacterized protein n=1 Tax=Papilio xuthus TaxID=66420 RepID=A0A194PJA0_PAPXU|nr:hypothetical protein RR46_10761 [Papilio xuthus]
MPNCYQKNKLCSHRQQRHLNNKGRVCSYGGDYATGYAVPGPPIPPPVTVVVVKDDDPMERILPILLLMMSR